MNQVPPVAMPEAEQGALRRLELLLSRILKVGTLASVALMALGTALSYRHHPGYFEMTAGRTGPGWIAAYAPCSLQEVAEGVGAGHGRAVIILGLLVLVATPVVRVAVALLSFARRRERVFAAFAAIVLALLLLSFQLGQRARETPGPPIVKTVGIAPPPSSVTLVVGGQRGRAPSRIPGETLEDQPDSDSPARVTELSAQRQ